MSLKKTYLGEYTLYVLENSVCYTKLAKVIVLNVLVHILLKYVRSTGGYCTRSANCNDVLTPSYKRNSGLRTFLSSACRAME